MNKRRSENKSFWTQVAVTLITTGGIIGAFAIGHLYGEQAAQHEGCEIRIDKGELQVFQAVQLWCDGNPTRFTFKGKETLEIQLLPPAAQ